MEDIRIHFVGGASIVAERAIGTAFWDAWQQYLLTGQPAGFTYDTDSGITRSIQFATVSYLERGKTRPPAKPNAARSV